MLMLSAADVEQCLPMQEAIAGMRDAFAALARGQVVQPPRLPMANPETNGILLAMPAQLLAGPAPRTAVKIVSVQPANPARGLPLIQGQVLLLDSATGRVLANLAGNALTAIRTGAVSGLATDLLALASARQAAIFGAGAQARTQLEAVCAVRAIERVQVYAPTPARLPPSVQCVAAASPQAALAGSEIVCAATTSAAPIFDDADLEPGAHVNAVGVFEPDKQEIPAATVARARLYVDDRAAAMEEAGDVLAPLRAGTIAASHLRGTLGELVEGTCAGRQRATDVTLFKSVGLAVQDVAAASRAYENALAWGLGQEFALET